MDTPVVVERRGVQSPVVLENNINDQTQIIIRESPNKTTRLFKLHNFISETPHTLCSDTFQRNRLRVHYDLQTAVLLVAVMFRDTFLSSCPDSVTQTSIESLFSDTV